MEHESQQRPRRIVRPDTGTAGERPAGPRQQQLSRLADSLNAAPPVQRLAQLNMGRGVVQLTGDDDKKNAALVSFQRVQRPLGFALQGIGTMLLFAVARNPRYAQLSFKIFHRQVLADLVRIKVGLATSVVGNHLMGTEDLLGSVTRGTRLDVRSKPTANHDKINWLLGLGHVVISGAVGRRALVLSRGVGKVPLGKLGALVHGLLMYQLLSNGTKLMGSEGIGSQLVRASRNQPKHAGHFEHTQAKENINDLISQILYPVSLFRLHQIAKMSNLPFQNLMRMRQNALALAGMLTALNLSPSSNLLPLLMGQSPGEVSFDPARNPLDATRTALGVGSAALGIHMMKSSPPMINSSARQFLRSLSFEDGQKLLMQVRMFGFGYKALYGGLALAQVLPVVYKLTHPTAKPEPDEQAKD